MLPPSRSNDQLVLNSKVVVEIVNIETEWIELLNKLGYQNEMVDSWENEYEQQLKNIEIMLEALNEDMLAEFEDIMALITKANAEISTKSNF